MRRPTNLSRTVRLREKAPSRLIAFDFETTRIARGTPRPLYLTAYGLDPEFSFAGAIDPNRAMLHLGEILAARFFIEDYSGVRYVAWNANNFDAYFVAAALLQRTDYVIRPYLTRSNSLRGLRIIRAGDEEKPLKRQVFWEVLDGMAMLGLGIRLEKLLDTFAPEHRKLTGTIDFEREEFDPANPQHQAYAYRDSVGLYHAMNRAQSILIEHFREPLATTMGAAGIRIFKSHIPQGIRVWNLPEPCADIVRGHVMRGGFCFCRDRYHGPVWKYDLNQAYAAAMREAWLPAGNALHNATGLHRYAQVYIAKVVATNPENRVPFYARTIDRGRIRAGFHLDRIDSWITSIEVAQLRAEGWKIAIEESWTFSERFRMDDYVNKLETLRTTCEGGPSGPIGTMTKSVGNNSYGKTAETLEAVEHLLSLERPAGYCAEVDPLTGERLMHVWVRQTEEQTRDYHQPHIAAFITAHVRMVLRRGILIDPDAWLYADTDCLVFSRDVTDRLDCDPKRYGAWKVEEQGAIYRIIAKKVYQNTETKIGHAKGLNVRRLSDDDFARWYDGSPPVQEQTQRNNFVSVMSGLEMFRTQTRTGTTVALD